MNNGVDFAVIDRILDHHGAQASNIIAILQDIQGEYRYLPREIFPYLARKLQMSAAKIYSVATFYENFSLEPKGKYVIKICDGTACHVRKSIPILEKMRETGLPERFHCNDGNGVRQVERPGFFNHRDADAVLFMRQKEIFRQSLRFLSENEDIVFIERHIRIRFDRLCRVVVKMAALQHFLHGFKVRMNMNLENIPVIQPCTLQVLVIDGKPEGFHQVERQMLSGTEP